MFLEAFTKNWKSALAGGVFRMMNLEFMLAGEPCRRCELRKIFYRAANKNRALSQKTAPDRQSVE